MLLKIDMNANNYELGNRRESDREIEARARGNTNWQLRNATHSACPQNGVPLKIIVTIKNYELLETVLSIASGAVDQKGT
jgi:hypothetical protein